MSHVHAYLRGVEAVFRQVLVVSHERIVEHHHLTRKSRAQPAAVAVAGLLYSGHAVWCANTHAAAGSFHSLECIEGLSLVTVPTSVPTTAGHAALLCVVCSTRRCDFWEGWGSRTQTMATDTSPAIVSFSCTAPRGAHPPRPRPAPARAGSPREGRLGHGKAESTRGCGAR